VPPESPARWRRRAPGPACPRTVRPWSASLTRWDTLAFLRRPILLTLAAALVLSAPALASFQPVRRSGVPRLQAGDVQIPAGHADGRVRVIVRLAEPPLAAALGRGLAVFGAT